MAYITPAELTTHLGTVQIETISDGDETMLLAAIDGAVSEMRGYLVQKYDIDTETKKTGEARNPLLLIFVKDMSVWHFVNICNVSTSLELRENRYNRAVSWLKAVQKGDVIPDLPVKTSADGTPDNTTPFVVGSNPKRTNHI